MSAPKAPKDTCLQDLGGKHGTDKHYNGFLPYYQKYMEPFREKQINVLEIGVFFGSSIKMWREYFPRATIYGLDHFTGKQGNGHQFTDASRFVNEAKTLDRVKLVECDQSNRGKLEAVRDHFIKEKIQFQFVIDDGSHLMKDQQQTLAILWPCITSGGIFFMEDWPSSLDRAFPDVRSDFSNTTYTVMKRWNEKRVLVSEYMTSAEQTTIEKTLIHPIDIFSHGAAGTAALIKK